MPVHKMSGRRIVLTVTSGMLLGAGLAACDSGGLRPSTAPPPLGGPSPSSVSPIGPSPTPTKSQSPKTWADTSVAATHDGKGWQVPDPLKASRDAWLAVAAEHLDPTGDLEAVDSTPRGIHLEWPAEGSDYAATTAAASAYATYGRLGLLVDPGDPNPLDDGCGYLLAQHEGAPDDQVSCHTERFEGPGGERARVSSWERRCGAYEGGVTAPATCGDYVVAVAVERRDGLIGFVVVDGRGTPDFNPLTPDAMAAAAADPRLTLPERAFAVPSDQAMVSVVEDHFPRYRPAYDRQLPAWDHPGYAHTSGQLGALQLYVQVWPAGGSPACGRGYLIECVERRVFGADDPTTVFVGAWDEEDWASCCPRNSRADDRTFVYVGPRHTVVVSELLIVEADEDPISAALDQRLIDLALDPQLQ